jgi:CRISPR-associated endonuclease/helicase Cas3
VLCCLLDANSFLRNRLHKLAPDFSSKDLEGLLLYFAVLHDLGKFAPAFQYQCEDIAKHLDSPTLPSRNFAHHTQMGKALFFHKDYRDVWHAAFVCRDDWQHRDILEPLADAAFGHHGKPPQPLSDASLHIPAPTVTAIRQFLGEVGNRFLPGGMTLPGGDDGGDALRPVSWLFAGLLVLADWIASGDGFPYVAETMDLSLYWNEYALPQARAAVAGCGVLPPPPSAACGFFDLLPHLRGEKQPTPLQAYAMDAVGRGGGPRLFLFEDVTGAGKTEAALLAAHALMAAGEAEGLYIGLPTMATANGMYARLTDSYRALFAQAPDAPPSLMLAHGARGIHDGFLGSIGLERGVPGAADTDASGDAPDNRESGAFCAAWLADNRKKALLAPCGVGTLDQALLAVLPAKHQCLRLLGLGRSVLVADEVHAYDVYTSKLLETLLTFHAGLGGSAILLSATLPCALKQRFADAFCRGAGYPAQVLTEARLPVATRLAADGFSETELPRTREIALDIETTDDPERVFALLAAVHRAGGCAIFVCNTVDRAVAATKKLRTLLPPGDVMLFHARYALCDRLAIEERVLRIFGKASMPETRRGKILIGTQVLEQSLDIDGDFIATELAPMELLLQRFGRGQRHIRDWRPEGFATARACVLAPRAVDTPPPDWGEAEVGKGLFVYPDRGLLWRTSKLLAAHPRIELPEHARELVEDAYNQEKFPTPEVFEASAQAREGKAWSEASLARANALRFEHGYGAEAADGRWHDDRVVPTRLGEPTETLRLLRVVGDGLELWAGPGRDAATCARSELSVPAWRVADTEPDAAWPQRLEDFAATLPDKGRWVKLFPLSETPTPGVWRSVLPGALVTYDTGKGLCYDDAS